MDPTNTGSGVSTHLELGFLKYIIGPYPEINWKSLVPFNPFYEGEF